MNVEQAFAISDAAALVVAEHIQAAHDANPDEWRAIGPVVRRLLDSFAVGYVLAYGAVQDIERAIDACLPLGKGNSDSDMLLEGSPILDAFFMYAPEARGVLLTCRQRLSDVAKVCNLLYAPLMRDLRGVYDKQTNS